MFIYLLIKAISMLKEKVTTNNNYLKMNIIYLLLIISNIALFIGLIYNYSKVGINIELKSFDYFSTIIPTIAILGYITLRLPQLRERGSALYDVSYLIIITVVGIMTSYFDGKANTSALFGPYLEMFRVLCVILVFILLSTRLKTIQRMIMGDYSKKNLLICFILFTLLGLYASHFHIDIDGCPANIRCLVVMISGLFGGPFVGIPVGIITGVYRYTLGGVTALPCAISTVLSGLIGSLIFVWNNKKFPRPIAAIILMFLFTGFEMLLVVMATPPEISFDYIRNVYPIMLFASVIGIILFTLVIRDEKYRVKSPEEEDSLIEEIEDGLEIHDEIKDLKDEISYLKNEIKDLKEHK